MYNIPYFNTILAAILVGHFKFMVIHNLTILETIALNLVTTKTWYLTPISQP
jgi:hypothetical protein